jgi:hypothetical protein
MAKPDSSTIFNLGRRYVALDKRIKSAVKDVDSTAIELIANCMDW